MANIQLGTISILINGREKLANAVQAVLTENSRIIMARTGINVQPKCVSDCLGLIMLAVQGSQEDLEKLTDKLSKMPEVTAKLSILAK